MVRVQISLEPETLRRARQRARNLGVSLSQYVRQLIQNDLNAQQTRKADISCIFNLGRSHGRSNIAKDKDEMIAEAFWTDLQRGRRRSVK